MDHRTEDSFEGKSNERDASTHTTVLERNEYHKGK